MECYPAINGWAPKRNGDHHSLTSSSHSSRGCSPPLYSNADVVENGEPKSNVKMNMNGIDSLDMSRMSSLWASKILVDKYNTEPSKKFHSSAQFNSHSREQNVAATLIPVELQVSNLDQNMDARDMKKILLNFFREHVMVLHVSVFVQSDGGLGAYIRVPSNQDAQLAISQLQRKKIGSKRIIISHVTQSSTPPEIKRSKIITLLQEVPGKKLPLFKFRELFERRYHETVGTSELYNMRDTVTVSDNNTGRMVSLNLDFRKLQSLTLLDSSVPKLEEMKYCKLHSKGPDLSVGWAERDRSYILPNVNLGLKVFGKAMQKLLQSHNGKIPLASLFDCYSKEIGPLKDDTNGIQIEHLVTCIPWLTIINEQDGFCKYVEYCTDTKNDLNESNDHMGFVSPSLVSQLSLFSREMVDLLKTFPICQLLFSRFIPAYHHHFGRQCRVADYGYTKLVDLFDALPHVIQILGEGKRKIITLAHKAQIRRFSSDLIRVLKNQSAKFISLPTLPLAFEKILNKPFNICDYGVCQVEDLLENIGESTILLSKQDDEIVIAIPKREQTQEEIERMRQFCLQVIELLRHSPQCMMQFNRFIPAYHHHFGRQCKVADYGFSKLVELFEAIPDYIKIIDEDDEGEKILQLVEKEMLKVFTEQICGILRNSQSKTMNLQSLVKFFTHYYGYSIRPSQFSCDSLLQLIGKLHTHVELIEIDSEISVRLIDRSSIVDLLNKSRTLLWEEPNCKLDMQDFIIRFTDRFKEKPDLSVLKSELVEFVQIEDNEICLTAVQIFTRDLIALLSEAGGRMLLSNFDAAYIYRFGISFRPVAYGYSDIVSLIQSLNDFVTIKGRGTKRLLVFNKETPIPMSFMRSLPTTPAKEIPVVEDDFPAVIQRHSYINPGDKSNHFSKEPTVTVPLATSNGNASHISSSWLQHKSRAKEMSPRWSMGSTPPPTRYQPASPVIFPGSPVNANSRMMWGQVWSPQYSVIQPMSPHYMIPSMPFNWNVPSLHQAPAGCFDSPGFKATPTPISIKSLDQLNKYSQMVPPRPEELPIPETLTQKNGMEDSVPNSCKESLTKSKKRLAVQFQNLSN